MALERLQKILARAGVASRRAAENVVTAGRVRVNGQIVTELGTRADPYHDKVEVDGKRIVAEPRVVILMHKPRTTVSTASDPEGRPTVIDLVRNVPRRLYPIGRLDFQTGGALLLTNDGDLAVTLLHPKRHVPKLYLVKVSGQMQDPDVMHWRKGIQLEDGPTLPAEVSVVERGEDATWIEVTLVEGRNQQIRRMGEATGFPVARLTRLSFAGISIDGLRAGQWRFLTAEELKDLNTTFGAPKHVREIAAEHERLRDLQPSGPSRPSQQRGDRRSGDGQAPPRRSNDDRPARGTRPQRPERRSDESASPRARRTEGDARTVGARPQHPDRGGERRPERRSDDSQASRPQRDAPQRPTDDRPARPRPQHPDRGGERRPERRTDDSQASRPRRDAPQRPTNDRPARPRPQHPDRGGERRPERRTDDGQASRPRRDAPQRPTNDRPARPPQRPEHDSARRPSGSAGSGPRQDRNGQKPAGRSPSKGGDKAPRPTGQRPARKHAR